MESQIMAVPRGSHFIGTAPESKQGHVWQARYAAIGANALHERVLIDGVNEAGLAGGIFYFPHHAQYQDVSADQYADTVAPWELLTLLLTTCASTSEVREKLATVKVAPVVLPAWGIVPPVHFIVHDSTGDSLVIEYLFGQLLVYDNPLGVITNAPSFDWHL